MIRLIISILSLTVSLIALSMMIHTTWEIEKIKKLRRKYDNAKTVDEKLKAQEELKAFLAKH